jgi:hypothetical protein
MKSPHPILSNNERFDRLSRALAAPIPRRRMLRLLAGTLAAGALSIELRPQGAKAAGLSCNPDDPKLRPCQPGWACSENCDGVFNGCCPGAWCGGCDNRVCAQPDEQCCGNGACGVGWSCCDESRGLCCPPGAQCCGAGDSATCCDAALVCCNDSGTCFPDPCVTCCGPACCSDGKICIDGDNGGCV